MNPFWRLPGNSLRSSAIRSAVVCLIVLLGLAPLIAAWTQSGDDYIRRCLAFYVGASLLIAGRLEPHHPYPRVGWANSVTLLRLALTAAVAALIGERLSDHSAWIVVATVVTVAVLDGVDGALARRRHEVSAFGARFDMETDAASILVLSILVWLHGKAGVWVIACGLMRYAFVLGGRIWPWMAGPLRSTGRGKTVAIAQLIGLAVALAPNVETPLSAIVAAAALAALTWSFAIDVAWLKRQAAAAPR